MKFTNPKTREQQTDADWAALEAATAPEPTPAPVVETPVAAPAPAVALTQEQFAALLGAIGAQAKGSGDEVADALSQVIKVLSCPILKDWATPLWTAAQQHQWVRPLHTYNCMAWEFHPQTEAIIEWLQAYLRNTTEAAPQVAA